MKTVVSIVLFLFISFLSAPTIISLIKKNTDISMFYNFNEEELHKDCKEIKADLVYHYDIVFSDLIIVKKSKIISEILSKHDNVAGEIVAPPPELI